MQPSSDLIGLIQVMSAVFGENSPVFARGSQPPPRPTYTPAAQPPPSYPGGPARPPQPGKIFLWFYICIAFPLKYTL